MSSSLWFAARLVVIGTAVVLAGVPVDQGDWTQWRGSARDGKVSGPAHAGEWPPQLRMLWQETVGGGYSGPIVADGRIWIHSREGEQEVVRSLSLEDGHELWSARYDAPFRQDPDARAHGRGPYATPSLADDRLFTLGITAILSAWDAETGELLWREDYSGEFERNYHYFGTSASPLVWGGLCFTQFGGFGWEDESSEGVMVALDVVDGRERWRWDSEPPSIGASPVIHRIGGRWHLIFKSREQIVGLDPASGQELWRIPFRVPQYNTIVTPSLVLDRLVTSDWDKGMHAWRVQSSGDTWTPRELWTTRAASMSFSSPVVIDRQVVGFSHLRRGQLVGVDPSDGNVLWQGEPRQGEHATLIAWGDDLLVFREDGSLVVGKVSRQGFRELRRYQLGRSLTWAHPAVVDGLIIYRCGDQLAVFSLE